MGMHFVMFHKTGARHAASNPDLPGLTLRLLMLAAANAQPGGHACFASGEVARLLPRTVDRETGEVTRYTPQRLNQALREGRDAGLFAPESTLRCIALALDVIEDRRPLKARPCPVHGHNLSWLDDRWVDSSDLARRAAASRTPLRAA